MFKVICIAAGDYEGGVMPHIGSIYCVWKVVQGWECMHSDETANFYLIEELEPDRAYHSKNFSKLSEIDETEMIREQLTETA